MSGLVCIQGGWSEVVWGGLEVVWWWFGANMAGLRNKNAFKFILQVFILSQKHILGVKKVVWCGLDVVWGVSTDSTGQPALQNASTPVYRPFSEGDTDSGIFWPKGTQSPLEGIRDGKVRQLFAFCING